MNPPMFSSLRARLTLWYAIFLGVVLFFSSVLLYQNFKDSLLANTDHTLLIAAEETATAIIKKPPSRWQEIIKQIERGFLVNRLFIQLQKISSKPPYKMTLVARSGILSGNIAREDLDESLTDLLTEQTIFLNINEDKENSHPMRLLLFPVQLANEKKYLIQVGTSLKKINHTSKNFMVVLAIFCPVLLFVSVFGGYLILTRALSPVQMVVLAARRISTEDLSHRIKSRNSKDEIGQLVTTFNEMIARLERSVQRIKQFSSDVSHDLKTPLTAIRGEIEITLRKERDKDDYKNTLISVQEEAKKLEKLIENLLLLSRIESAAEDFLLEPIALDEVLLEVFEKTDRLAHSKGLVYSIERIMPVRIAGNHILLSRLIINLVDNSIKYTPSGGTITIGLRKIGNNALLSVHDTGIGIPKESLPLIFERFYRVDLARSQNIASSGLGLSIVKGIAGIHKAIVTVNSRVNKGTTVKIRFPVLPEDADYEVHSPSTDRKY